MNLETNEEIIRTNGTNGIKLTADMTNPAEYYDAVAKGYDQIFSGPIYQAEEKAVFDLLQNRIRGEILDIGCGTGLFLEYQNPKDYVGVDISSKMVKKAQLKYPDRQFVVADMQEYVASLPDASIDTIFSMFGALSYSLTPTEFVAQCKRVLRKHGRIIMMPITQRTGAGLYLSNTTVTGNKIPKICYSTQMARDLFQDFDEVNVMGLNYFGNMASEMSTKFGHNFDIEQLQKFLVHESRTSTLPIEYARHGIILATK